MGRGGGREGKEEEEGREGERRSPKQKFITTPLAAV